MDEQKGVLRERVADVVRTMMADLQVKLVAIIYQDSVEGGDRFNVVPYHNDPTT